MRVQRSASCGKASAEGAAKCAASDEPLALETISRAVGRGARTLEAQVVRPADQDSVVEYCINAHENQSHENSRRALHDPMPYWATLWPAGDILADLVASASTACCSDDPVATWGYDIVCDESDPQLKSLREALDVRNKRVMDVGAGLALCSVIAAKSGAREVFAVDHDRLAISVIERTKRANGLSGSIFHPTCLDWNDLRPWPRDLDVILAADVLYDSSAVYVVISLPGSLSRTLPIVSRTARYRHAAHAIRTLLAF